MITVPLTLCNYTETHADLGNLVFKLFLPMCTLSTRNGRSYFAKPRQLRGLRPPEPPTNQNFTLLLCYYTETHADADCSYCVLKFVGSLCPPFFAK